MPKIILIIQLIVVPNNPLINDNVESSASVPFSIVINLAKYWTSVSQEADASFNSVKKTA